MIKTHSRARHKSLICLLIITFIKRAGLLANHQAAAVQVEDLAAEEEIYNQQKTMNKKLLMILSKILRILLTKRSSLLTKSNFIWKISLESYVLNK